MKLKDFVLVLSREDVDKQKVSITKSPVARYDTLRVILAISAYEHMKLKQIDIKTSFLHGNLEETILMKQPPSFDDNSGRVCLLEKSFYGIKQGPGLFNKKIDEVLRNLNLTQNQTDNCLCYRHTKDSGSILLAVYVDDLLLATTNEFLQDYIIKGLSSHFTITASGPNLFLGMQISIDENNNIRINQQKYIKNILARFKTENCRPNSVPADPGIYNFESRSKEQKERPYREIIGSLMHSAIATRCDIAFIVSSLSRFLDSYTDDHWNAALKVLRYLQSSSDLSIFHSGTETEQLTETLEVYTDSDYAGCKLTRISVSGLLAKLNNGLVIWAASQQKRVSLSTTESEFISVTEGAKACLWLKHLFNEVRMPITPRIFVDNQTALTLISNPSNHKRTKHIHVRHFFIRDTYENKQIEYE